MQENLFNLKGLFHIIGFLIIPVIFFYIIFAFVLSRQVKLLNKSFSTPAASALSTVATAHLLLSIVIAFFALLSV